MACTQIRRSFSKQTFIKGPQNLNPKLDFIPLNCLDMAVIRTGNSFLETA